MLTSGLDKINILDDLYNQINSVFRLVHIEPCSDSSVDYADYCPKHNAFVEASASQQGSSELDQSCLQLKYDTAADKIATLNYCQSPIEKILMVKWVSESIRQDNEVYLPSNSSPVLMCADTLVSIFAYIIALSRNHLMYAHLLFAN